MKNISTRLELLFDLIDRAKNISDYFLANLVYACLLENHLQDKSSKINISWESSDPKGRAEYDPEQENEYYYDLLILRMSDRSACIPLPLIKEEWVKSFFPLPWDYKKVHNRSPRKPLPLEKEEILAQILDLCPNAYSLADKYLLSWHEERCSFCQFHSRESYEDVDRPVCSVYPSGWSDTAKLCPDFQAFQA